MNRKSCNRDSASRNAENLRNGMLKNGNFTLIELLIVVAIIAILAGMLLPALNSAREKARAILCTGSLKQFGLSFHNYTDSNNDYYPWDSLAPTNYQVFWRQMMMRSGVLPYKTIRASNGLDTHREINVCPSRSIKDGSYGDNYLTTNFAADYNNSYLMNAVGGASYGFGLRAASTGASGCKTQQVRQPSRFGVLVEKADFKQFGMSYLSVQGFANNKYWHCAVRPAAAPNVSVDMTVHGSNANYLFADGHAASMKYNTVQWKLFGLQKSDIDNNYCYLGPR